MKYWSGFFAFTTEKTTEQLIDDGVVQTFEFFATLPSKKNRVTNYFGISAINEFDNEITIENFLTLEELENYTLIPKEKYSKYNYYEALLIYSEDGIIEKRISLKQINNKKENKKVRKLHRR